jgi:hypothetical protein
MEQIVKIEGIKCDNPNCDYRNDDVAFEDYSKWINASCPKCGENLLTEQDYNFTKIITEKMNSYDFSFLPENNDFDGMQILPNEIKDGLKQVPIECLAECLDIAYNVMKETMNKN